MQKLTLMGVLAASLLTACSQEQPNKIEAPVVTENTEKKVAETSVVTPPKARMNFAVGKGLIVQRAKPSQLGARCENIADVRGFRPSCRGAINEMAKAARFKPSTCEAKNFESDGIVVCNGLVETKIGSAKVAATFRQVDEKWQSEEIAIVKGSWTPS